ncbi:type II secretion system secretin GspD [uncultured Maricaulis sp.]|uniref:type II secretion system secretin GspD n=1 Tax=uncultured Maricaulis sp. TaxID=174710 RepID=UPI0030DA4D96|tara:strand:- start:93794 stop:95773 length:1980 start_codon:yes stop_codon:yes gene_type:complete
MQLKPVISVIGSGLCLLLCGCATASGPDGFFRAAGPTAIAGTAPPPPRAEAAIINATTTSPVSDPAPPALEPWRRDATAAVASPPRHQARDTGNGVELAFDSAPIAEVVSAVIGDLLGEAFVIDPSVSGLVSLRSAGLVPRADVPRILEQSLAMAGVSLARGSDGTYLVTPVGRGSAVRARPQPVSAGLPVGQGIVIVPLRYISAHEMADLLRPMTRESGEVIADEPRETLILSGSAEDVEAMLDMVTLFDADWLSQMSIAVYPLRVASPDAMVGELNAVMGGQDGPIGSQLELVALNRLNAVIAIANHSYRLDQVEAWITRLDVRPANGRQIRVRNLVNSEAPAVAQHLTDLFAAQPGSSGAIPVTVRADESMNSLLIAADENTQREIEAVITQLDHAPDQVLIEAMIVEVVLTDDLRYGVQWYFDTRDGGELTSTSNSGGGISAHFPGFSYTYSADFVRAALNAISSLTQVDTIASPQIVVRNNHSAIVQVGDQVPIVTQSAVSVADPNAPIVNSIQFRDTGVVLRVTARIDPSGLIVLDVAQEVSSVAATTTSGIDSPTIQQRRLESTVSLYDGEAVVLGGLIRSQQTRTRSGIPGLQRLPGLGNLFRDTSDTTRRTELLVFLTPHVMHSRQDSIDVTQRLRERMDYLRNFGFRDD